MKARVLRHRRCLLFVAALVACGGAKTPPPGHGSQVVTSGSGSGGTVETPPRPVDPEDQPLPLWPKIRHGKLSNGLTYYVLPHKKPEKRALLWLAVNAGAVLEDDDQRGLAHFDEHMAFNGTKRFAKNDIINYLEKIGMRFGADLNAYTNFDETVYQLEVPTDNPEFITKGFDILRDWAGDITFDPVEVDKERGVVEQEWRQGRGFGQRLFDKNSKVLFKGSRYADRLTIGLQNVIMKAPVSRLVQFYKDWYRPDLMAVIAVGEFDDAAIEQQIKATFGDLKNPPSPKPRVKAQVPKADGTRVSIATDHELPSARVTVYNLVPHRPEASLRDLRRITAEQVFTYILNDRLRTVSRTKDAPFTFASAGIGGVTREIDGFTRSAGVKNHKVEEALKALFTEVVRVEKHGFLQTEMDRAVADILKSSEQSAIREATTDGRSFTSEMTRHFFEGEFMLGRVAEHERTAAIMPSIKLEDVNKLAATLGGAANRVIVVNGPDGKPLPDAQRVLAIIDEVEKSSVTPWVDQGTSNVPLMTAAPAPGKITKEARIDKIDVTEWTLSNGVRVIVKPTDFTADAVTISGNSPGGLAMASDALFPHARFADDIVSLGGAGEHDRETLTKILAGKSASASASIGGTTESLDGGGSVKDLETIFQLMYLRATAPRKDDAQIAVWKTNSIESITNRRRSPDTRFQLEAAEAMWKGALRRKPAEVPDIEKLDVDKAIAFWKDRFADFSDFTFVIVGSVDLAKLRPLVETYLASLPAKGRKEKEKDLGVRRAGGVVTKTFTLGSEKASVSRTYHNDEAWTRDKERDMFVLSRVLSIRLRETLREDLGGVYGVGAGGFLSRVPRAERTFSINFGCDPKRVDELIKAAEGVIADVAKNGASGELLDKVKKTFERERETAMRTNGFWVNWLASSARYGDDPTLVLDLNPTIARMTSANVKASVAKYLDARQYFQAVMKPATP